MLQFAAIAIAIVFIAVMGLTDNLTVATAVPALALPATVWLLRNPPYLVGAAFAAHGWGIYSFGAALTPMKFTNLLLIVMTVGQMTARGRIERVPTRFITAILLMFSLVTVSEINAAFGADIDSHLELAGTFVFLLILTQQFRDTSALRVLAIVVAFNILAESVFVMRELSWTRMMAGFARARGPTGQPNILANLAATSMPFCAAVLFDARGNRLWLRLSGLVAMGGCAYIQYAAASRGGTFSMIVAVVASAVLLPTRMATRVVALAVAGLLIVAFADLAPKSFRKRVIATTSSAEKLSEHQSERFDHVQFAMRMIPERPLLGHGRSGFAQTRAYENRGRLTALHSSITSIFVAYGVPTALLYLGILSSSMWLGIKRVSRWRRNRVYGYALVASLAAGIMASMTGTDLFRVSLWGLVAMIHVLAIRPESLTSSADTAPDEATAPVATPPDPTPAVPGTGPHRPPARLTATTGY